MRASAGLPARFDSHFTQDITAACSYDLRAQTAPERSQPLRSHFRALGLPSPCHRCQTFAFACLCLLGWAAPHVPPIPRPGDLYA